MFNFIQPLATYGIYNSTNRFDEGKREFNAMLANNPDGSTVPNFRGRSLRTRPHAGPELRQGSPKPEVADNDYAIGRFLETLATARSGRTARSSSLRTTRRTARHVMDTLSVGFVVSPYIKNGAMSSKFYNTNSFLHTWNCDDARPLSQFDAIADYVDAWNTVPNQ